MAAAAHRTARAVAAAGGLAFLFSSDHTDDNQCNRGSQGSTNENGRKVFG